ncbi:UDP-glycosyltransferase 708G1-like [Nymphaea colorata]|uniref:UDP-glycosyltransferase 708G1-like n=1 Tax=Nymphaea colorata TaxID=210225 RepID=UPI00129DFCF7|nr:UDP-glycosyltransferase 708G1-like [Nymphaea colorata]
MNSEKPWIVLVPSAGMSHILLFIRFASTIMEHGLNVVFVATKSTVSSAESHHISQFLSSSPSIQPLWYDPLPLNPDFSHHKTADPYYLHFDALSRSKDVLLPLLSQLATKASIAAFISDIFLASCMCDVAESLSIPNYVLYSSSATMLAFSICFSSSEPNGDPIEEILIPGVGAVPSYCVPPALKNPEHLFTTVFHKNNRALSRATGVLLNTFYKLEAESLQALNGGKLAPTSLRRVFPIGPLVGRRPAGGESCALVTEWLDEQPEGRVLYISFGSRTPLAPEQIVELANGLEMAGCNFLWMLKTKIVDKEESQGEAQNVLPDGFVERVKPRGLVADTWADQEEVLAHRSVGGFLGHCGWSSVVEAVWHGVPIFGWPQAADQLLNAMVVERSGLGFWERSWRGSNGGELIKGEEIGRQLRLWMGDKHVKERARQLREEARTSIGAAGDSHRTLAELMDAWKAVA